MSEKKFVPGCGTPQYCCWKYQERKKNLHKSTFYDFSCHFEDVQRRNIMKLWLYIVKYSCLSHNNGRYTWSLTYDWKYEIIQQKLFQNKKNHVTFTFKDIPDR